MLGNRYVRISLQKKWKKLYNGYRVRKSSKRNYEYYLILSRKHTYKCNQINQTDGRMQN